MYQIEVWAAELIVTMLLGRRELGPFSAKLPIAS